MIGERGDYLRSISVQLNGQNYSYWIYESCDLNRTCSGYHVNNTNINTEGKKKRERECKIKDEEI